jgi:ApaG protein
MNLSNNIKIDVTTRYLKEQSDPFTRRFAFAYTVEIINEGVESVKLLNRYWHIADDNDHVQEVQGEGVIGKQPEIPPGSSFKYTSGTVISTEVGTMKGNYEMLWASGEKFKAPIPAFLLAIPHTVH